jgi:hypothetical protein
MSQTTNQACALLNLPAELILKIAQHLDYDDRFKLCQASPVISKILGWPSKAEVRIAYYQKMLIESLASFRTQVPHFAMDGVHVVPHSLPDLETQMRIGEPNHWIKWYLAFDTWYWGDMELPCFGCLQVVRFRKQLCDQAVRFPYLPPPQVRMFSDHYGGSPYIMCYNCLNSPYTDIDINKIPRRCSWCGVPGPINGLWIQKGVRVGICHYCYISNIIKHVVDALLGGAATTVLAVGVKGWTCGVWSGHYALGWAFALVSMICGRENINLTYF